MFKKIISLTLMLTLISGIACTGSVFTKTVFANEIKAEDATILCVSGPTHGGTEDIIAHDTVWKYGVTQPTNLGIAVGVASGLLGASGKVKIIKNSTVNYIAQQLGGFAINHVFKLSNTVNIRFDRYKLRGANGRIYYKVYASYYKLNGEFIDSKLVQSY